MKRRQILKAAILAPFVGLFKSKRRKKLNVEIKIGDTVTVPEGQVWEVHRITTTSSDLTYMISGYLVE